MSRDDLSAVALRVFSSDGLVASAALMPFMYLVFLSPFTQSFAIGLAHVCYRVGKHLAKYVWGITPRPDNEHMVGHLELNMDIDMKPHAMRKNLRLCKKKSRSSCTQKHKPKLPHQRLYPPRFKLLP